MAAPTRGMLGGRLDDEAAAGAAENRRGVVGRDDAGNLEDWPRQRVAARSRNLMVVSFFYCG